MAIDNSSDISVDTQTVNTNGTITAHFDLTFTNSTTTSVTIDYSITGSCAVFAENGQTTLSHTKGGLTQFNNIFNDPLQINGNCQDAHFILKIICNTADDQLSKSFPISYNPVAADALQPKPKIRKGKPKK